MPIVNVLTVDPHPARRRRYLDLCHELAEHAKNAHEKLHWTAHETRIGRGESMHFVIGAEDFTSLEKMGTPEAMFARVLGEQRAVEWMDEVSGCVREIQQSISIDRPDLSYSPREPDRTAPLAIVTTAEARPGHQEGAEELIRKIAEAIPKVNDGTQLLTYQTVIGDLARYWTVRPLSQLSEIDRQLPPPMLLDEAFGPAEGGLIFRSGLDAMARVERNIVAYRPELSNAD